MATTERDLDAIKRLLARSEWIRIGCSEEDADRFRAAVALAWYCGAKVKEIARLTPAHWKPEGQNAIQMPENDAPLKNADARRLSRRLIPLLDPARALVDPMVAAAAGRGANALVFAQAAKSETSPRGALEQLGPKLMQITGGAVPTLGDLRSRLASYVAAAGVDKACAAWLSGTPGEHYLGRRPAPPSLDELRGVLLAVHPLPRAERWMWRDDLARDQGRDPAAD